MRIPAYGGEDLPDLYEEDEMPEEARRYFKNDNRDNSIPGPEEAH